MRKCVYCSKELSVENVIDVCTACGHGVWGERMFSVIISNMQQAHDKGDLHQGSVADSVAV